MVRTKDVDDAFADGQEEEVQDEYWEEETATSSSTFTNKCVRTFGAWQGGLSLLVLTHSLGKGVTASGLGGRPGRATTARLSARCRVLKALRRRGGGCAACTRVLRRGPGHHLCADRDFSSPPRPSLFSLNRTYSPRKGDYSQSASLHDQQMERRRKQKLR